MLAIIAGVRIKGGSRLFSRRRRADFSTPARGRELIANLACMAYLSVDAVIVLLGHIGFLSRLTQGFNQCVCIFIDDERGDRVVEGLLKSSWSCFPMNATWKELVFGE